MSIAALPAMPVTPSKTVCYSQYEPFVVAHILQAAAAFQKVSLESPSKKTEKVVAVVEDRDVDFETLRTQYVGEVDLPESTSRPSSPRDVVLIQL